MGNLLKIIQISKKNKVNINEVKKQLIIGYPFELEHKKQFEDLGLKDKELQTAIDTVVLTHLDERIDYYALLKKVENKGSEKPDSLNKQLIREVKVKDENVKIYSVNRNYILANGKDKTKGYVNFVEGGHRRAGMDKGDYYFIPDGEIYIADYLLNDEIALKSTILHEVEEYSRMKYNGDSYEDAHKKALNKEIKFIKAEIALKAEVPILKEGLKIKKGQKLSKKQNVDNSENQSIISLYSEMLNETTDAIQKVEYQSIIDLYNEMNQTETFEKGGNIDLPDVYAYQDSHAEKIVSNSWNGAGGNYWRYKFENAGDVLRELGKYSHGHFDTGYIYEKINKIETFIKNITTKFVHPDDKYSQMVENNKENLNELKQAYINQPVNTVAQEKARILVLNLISNNLKEAQNQIDYFNNFRGKSDYDEQTGLYLENNKMINKYKHGGNIKIPDNLTELQKRELQKINDNYEIEVKEKSIALKRAITEKNNVANRVLNRCGLFGDTEANPKDIPLFETKLECNDSTYNASLKPYTDKIKFIKNGINNLDKNLQKSIQSIVLQKELAFMNKGGNIEKEEIKNYISESKSEAEDAGYKPVKFATVKIKKNEWKVYKNRKYPQKYFIVIPIFYVIKELDGSPIIYELYIDAEEAMKDYEEEIHDSDYEKGKNIYHVQIVVFKIDFDEDTKEFSADYIDLKKDFKTLTDWEQYDFNYDANPAEKEKEERKEEIKKEFEEYIEKKYKFFADKYTRIDLAEYYGVDKYLRDNKLLQKYESHEKIQRIILRIADHQSNTYNFSSYDDINDNTYIIDVVFQSAYDRDEQQQKFSGNRNQSTEARFKNFEQNIFNEDDYLSDVTEWFDDIIYNILTDYQDYMRDDFGIKINGIDDYEIINENKADGSNPEKTVEEVTRESETETENIKKNVIFAENMETGGNLNKTSNYDVIKSKHTKTGKDIWIVKPSDRFDHDTYKSVESRIKQNGGYYSRFVRGFVFNSEPNNDILDNIFGVAEIQAEKISTIPYSQKGLIAFYEGKTYDSVNRGVLRKEWESGKLIAGMHKRFNGMTDGYDYIKDSDIIYSTIGEDKQMDEGISRTLARDYQKPYANGNSKTITLDDYYFKYKPEITVVEVKKPKGYFAENYFVDLDSDKDVKINTRTQPSHDKDLNIKIGTRVRVEVDGSYYCGLISDRKINSLTSTSRMLFGSEPAKTETTTYARYKIKLDNGIEFDRDNFDIKEDCGEIEQPPIKFNNEIKFPQKIWSDIKGEVTHIKNGKKSLASRKAEKYRVTDQKYIKTHITSLRKFMSAFLGWELANKEYVENITGENADAQTERRNLWQQKLNIEPDNSAVISHVTKESAEINKEQIIEKQTQKEEQSEQLKERINSIEYPNDIMKSFVSIYLSGKDDFEGRMNLDRTIFMTLSGDRQKDKRQKILSELVGKEVSKANAGVNAIKDVVLEFIDKNINKPEPKKNDSLINDYNAGLEASKRNWKENTPIKEVFEKAGKKYPEPEKKEIISETITTPNQTDQDLIDLAFEMGEKANKTGGSRASSQNKEFMDFFFQKGEPPIDTIKILDAYIKGYDSLNINKSEPKAEQTKEAIEKLLKGLEIQAKYKPTDELTKRINGLKIVLKYKK